MGITSGLFPLGAAPAEAETVIRVRQPASSLMFASVMILRYSAICSFQ